MRDEYPPVLEAFWRKKASEVWPELDDETLIARARARVQALSDRFTIDRKNFYDAYGDDPETQAAYGLFFFPQTFARTQLALKECWRPPSVCRRIRIGDLGAGTGAAGFAALLFLGDRPAALTAFDRSSRSLETLTKAFNACRALWPQAEIRVMAVDIAEPAKWIGNASAGQKRLNGATFDRFDLALCSFALNELCDQHPSFDPASWINRVLNDALAEDGLFVILEPALQSCAERLERIRDTLVGRKDLVIAGPCPHHAPCPMRAEGKFWCHEVREWTPPPLAEKINRRLFRELPRLKFSFLALKRLGQGASRNEGSSAVWARLVAPVTEQRGKFITRACCHDGRLRDIELLNRHLNAEQRASLRRLERGTRICFEPEKELGNGVLRVRAIQPIN